MHQTGATGRGRPRILVLEEDARISQTIKSAFEAAGYDVLQAFDHRAAQRQIDTGPTDFALLDIVPTRSDDIEVAQRLAAERVPFVFVSAHGDSALIERAVDSGALGFFVKPLDASLIAPSIRIWIARAAELRQMGQSRQSLVEASRKHRSIGTAVGVIMERHQLSPERAFDALRRQARNDRLKLDHLAARIVAGIASLAPTSPSP